MDKAVFYLEGPKAQHEGNRLLMMSKMIEHHFEYGSMFNLPDTRVEVLLGGSKEEIIKFHNLVREDFTNWVKNKVKDHQAVKDQIGNPGILVTDLTFSEHIRVHKIGLFSHSLTFDQIHKGVDIYGDLKKVIKKNLFAQNILLVVVVILTLKIIFL